ncbi:MAG TPA: FecR domain-containing protein [Candidatus Binatus sp.]|nr:FecR domain-containing protein [Candidatus Binatus sp.]
MNRSAQTSWLRILAMVIVATIALASVARAQSTVGTITELKGSATIQRGSATTPAMLNEPVMLHDRIATDKNASMTIGLVDKSFMQLNELTTLTIDDSMLVNGVGAPSKVGLLGGDLHSVILGAMRGNTTKFEVHTPNAIGAVRGTDFWVHYDTNARP